MTALLQQVPALLQPVCFLGQNPSRWLAFLLLFYHLQGHQAANTSLLAYRQVKNEALSGDKMLELFCTLSPADRKTRSPFLQRRHSATLERQLLSSLCSKTEQSMLSSDDDIVLKCRVVMRATTCSVGIQPKRLKSVDTGFLECIHGWWMQVAGTFYSWLVNVSMAGGCQ